MPVCSEHYHVLEASQPAHQNLGFVARIKGGVLNQGTPKGKPVQTRGFEPKGVGTAVLGRAGLLTLWHDVLLRL